MQVSKGDNVAMKPVFSIFLVLIGSLAVCCCVIAVWLRLDSPVSATSAANMAPRKLRRKVFPFMQVLDYRLGHERATRESRTPVEEAAGIASDLEIMNALIRVIGKEAAVNAVGVMDLRDIRAALAGTPSPFIVEVGAALGEDTAVYALLADRVIAYEAGPKTASKLSSTMDDLNELMAQRGVAIANVTVVDKAVSDSAGTMDLHLVWGDSDAANLTINGVVSASDVNGSAPGRVESLQDSLVPQPWANGLIAEGRRGSTTVPVQVVRLDDQIYEHVDFLEIDVQGADFAVLRGARRLIEEHGVGVIRVEFTPSMLRDAGDDPVEMLHWLYDRGYVCFDTPAVGDGIWKGTMWQAARQFVAQPGGEWGGEGRPGTGERRLGGGLIRGPVLFEDFVKALDKTMLEFSGQKIQMYTDLLCFQN